MDALDWCGLGAFALICLVFYGVRKIAVYVICCVMVVFSFLWATSVLVDGHQAGEWLVLGAGLVFCSFGLLIVRVMLIRSVSLQLLARLSGGGNAGGVTEDIGGRLNDMEYFRLIRRGEQNRLTAFGWFCSTVVVIFYTLFRIK